MLEDVLIRKRPRMQKLEQIKKFYDQKNIPKNVVLGTKRAHGRGKISGVLPFDGIRKVILICGKQNSGKSVIAARLVEELYHKFGIPFLWIDPKHEFIHHIKPLRESHAKRFGLYLHDEGVVGRPKGLGETVVITPFSLVDNVEVVGKVSSIHLADILRLKDRQISTNLLMELLEIKGNAFVAARRQFAIVVEEVRKSKSWTFKNLLARVRYYLRGTRDDQGKKQSYIIGL